MMENMICENAEMKCIVEEMNAQNERNEANGRSVSEMSRELEKMKPAIVIRCEFFFLIFSEKIYNFYYNVF